MKTGWLAILLSLVAVVLLGISAWTLRHEVTRVPGAIIAVVGILLMAIARTTVRDWMEDRGLKWPVSGTVVVGISMMCLGLVPLAKLCSLGAVPPTAWGALMTLGAALFYGGGFILALIGGRQMNERGR